MEKKILPARIRPITEHDSELMIAFFSSFSEETRRFFTPHEIDPEGLRRLARGIPSNPTARRFMAAVVEGGKEVMAGYVFFWEWNKMVPWLGIGVSDRFQGRGLGNQMMEFAIRLAKEHHKGGILLTTWKDNLRAQRLYQKFGFEIIGQEKNLIEYLMILNFPDPNFA